MDGQGELSVGMDSMLQGFMSISAGDPRIGPSHISLFFSFLYFYIEQGQKNPISVFSKEVMKFAKVSVGTYHRCIQELQEYGIIKYIPSYNPILGSLIYLSK
jgi:hypothetical protein